MPSPMMQMKTQNDEDYDYLIIAKIRNATTDTRMVSTVAAARFLNLSVEVVRRGRTGKFKSLQYEESLRGWLLNVGELVRLKNQLEVIDGVARAV